MTPPPLFKHQQELLDKTRDERAWAIFWMTGCGKTAPTIRTAVHLFERREIDRVVVVAPNMVHRNWTNEEVPRHCPIRWIGLDWHSSRAKAQDRALAKLVSEPTDALRWLAISFDALITPRGRQAVIDFVTRSKFLLVIDEGSRVSNPTAVRTKKVAALRKLAAYVRLLNGTPVGSKGAVDVYAQMKILDENYWIRHGIGSFTAFQSRFCIFKKIVIGGEDDREANEVKAGKREPIVPHDAGDVAAYEQLDLDGFEQTIASETPAVVGAQIRASATPATTGRTIEVPVGFRDLDKLHQMLQPLSSRLTKEQAGLDLPPKLYQRLMFELAPEQRRVYDQLRKEYMVELDGGKLVTAPLAMTRILRLQQIACGYLPNPDDPEGDPILIPGAENPRLRAFMDWLEDVGRQAVIVWCRFTHDVDLICRELGPAKCTRFDGEVSSSNKEIALDLFKSGKRQICVAKASSMGMGLTLAFSHLAFYYSNTFSLLERLQSEDRQHRPGQHNAVTYVDLIADRTVDSKILKSLREAHDVADRVTGDSYRSWLEES